jgi:hypothetical protein
MASISIRLNVCTRTVEYGGREYLNLRMVYIQDYSLDCKNVRIKN